MAYSNVEVIEKQEQHAKTWFQRFRNKLGGAAAVTTLAVSNAHAEGLSDIGTVFTGQLSSAETIVVTILVAAATLTAIIIGYKKLNSGAKSA